MGWSGGTEIAEKLIKLIDRFDMKESEKFQFYKNMITILEDQDWDNACEIRGMNKLVDTALKQLHPDWD